MAEVLLADDSPTHTALMRSLLQDASHTVHCVADGKQAVKRLREGQPDVVVTDLRMPEMNGLELVQHIAREYPKLPSIVVTARGSEALAVDALALGAANFVPKNSLGVLLGHVVARTVRMAKMDRLYSGLAGRLQKPEFSFSLRNHVASIEPVTLFVVQSLAAARCMDRNTRVRVGTAVASALFNSICFGNLEIKDDSEAVRALAGGDASTEAEFDGLADSEPYVSRRVSLKVSVGVADTRILVSHDGPGSLTRRTPAPGTPESFELEQCRGLMLMTSFMDDVVFYSDNSEVVMVKRHAETGGRAAG